MRVWWRTPQPMAFRAKNQGWIARMLDLPLRHRNEKSRRWNAENNDEHYGERSSVHAKKYRTRLCFVSIPLWWKRP